MRKHLFIFGKSKGTMKHGLLSSNLDLVWPPYGLLGPSSLTGQHVTKKRKWVLTSFFNTYFFRWCVNLLCRLVLIGQKESGQDPNR